MIPNRRLSEVHGEVRSMQNPGTTVAKPVFLSYSRHDADYARRFADDLRALGFVLWRDRESMAVGDDWWRQIQEAIRESDTVVLCLSPMAVRSPVVEREWQYARQVGTRVMPVLAADVDLESAPRWMRRVDWVDVRPDAPERDAAWSRFTDQLREPYRRRKVPFMAESLGPDYVPRPEVMKALIASLVDERKDAIGNTIALVGTGGFGKTTLARALCHDPAVRGAFDDGILWITLGEHPVDPLGRHLDLIEVLSGERPGFLSAESARAMLAELLADRYLVLVLDDAWNRAHVEPFLVAGRQCATVITTRNFDVVPPHAQMRLVDTMSTNEAVTLLRRGLPDGEVEAVECLAKRLGGWPLLLKLANGPLIRFVAEGRTLGDALAYADTALTRRGLRYFDHTNPVERDQAVAATLGVSIDLLTPAEHERFRRLAIFPENVAIPTRTLARLWGLDDFDTEETCRKLFNGSLLMSFDVRTAQIHDVIRAYLRDENASRLIEWNLALLDAYGLRNWHELPGDEPYLWDHLVGHFIEAGAVAEVRRLFQDQAWMAARIAHDGYRLSGYLSDCSLAWRQVALAEALRQIDGNADPDAFAEGMRYALIMASLASQTMKCPAALAARATVTGLWTPAAALSQAAGTSDPALRTELYAALLATDALDEEERDAGRVGGLNAARALANSPDSKAKALAALIPHLLADERDRVVAEAVQSAAAVVGRAARSRAMLALVPHLNGGTWSDALAALEEVAAPDSYADDGEIRAPWTRAMAALAGRAGDESGRTLLDWTIRTALSQAQEWELAEELEAIVPYVDEPALADLRSYVDQCLSILLPASDPTVAACASTAVKVLQGQLRDLDQARELASHVDPRMTLHAAGKAIPVGERQEKQWACLLAALAGRINGEPREWAIKCGLTAALSIRFSADRAAALASLVPHLHGSARAWTLAHALEAASRAYTLEDRMKTLALLIEHLEGPERAMKAARCLDMIRRELPVKILGVTMSPDRERSRSLVAIAPMLTGDLLAEGLDIAESIRDPDGYGYRSAALAAMAPRLDRAGTARALRTAMVIEDEAWQIRALASLAGGIAGVSRNHMLERCLGMVPRLGGPIKAASALADLGGRLSESQRGAWLDLVDSLESGELKLLAVGDLLDDLRGEEKRRMTRRALSWALQIENHQARAYALARVAAHVEGGQKIRCLHAAVRFRKRTYQGVVLSVLVQGQLTPCPGDVGSE